MLQRFAKTCGAACAALLLALPVSANPPDRITRYVDVPTDFEFYPLPPGEGVDEVYYGCLACHSLRTVTNGGYSRAVWDELLDWMVAEQGMMEPEPDIRAQMLDYLATYIGEDWEG
jgi:cytochrome c